MDIRIRPASTADIDDLVQLTILAFEPVFGSFRQIQGPQIYPIVHPDWKARQRDDVEAQYKDDKIKVWVAKLDGTIVGVVTYELNDDEKTGEVRLLAVHPEYQNRGIGTALNNFALQKMQEAGMILAIVRTGGGEAQAPARRSYEKAGYTAVPLVRFYKKL